MPASEAQKRANAKYRKKMKQITIRFSPNELDVWEHAQNHDNVAGYIKQLIRADMEHDQ